MMRCFGLKKIGQLWVVTFRDMSSPESEPYRRPEGRDEGLTGVQRGRRGGRSALETTAVRWRVAAALGVDAIDDVVCYGLR
jgi:hypothetical protein